LLRPRAHSHYDALQASLSKRSKSGLTVEAFYTWSKCSDDSSSTYALEYDTGLQENPYSLAQDRGPCSFNAAHNFSGTVLYSLPFHGNKFVEGWELSNIVQAQSGHPVNAFIGFDQGGLNETVVNVERPSIAPGRSLASIVTHNPEHWFDPSAFVLPPPGSLGDAPRNAFIGPHLVAEDFAIIKNTRLDERVNVQFRAEAFNVFNHTNFAPPAFGTSGIFLDSSGTPNPTAGKITGTATTSRQLQFALKVIF